MEKLQVYIYSYHSLGLEGSLAVIGSFITAAGFLLLGPNPWLAKFIPIR